MKKGLFYKLLSFLLVISTTIFAVAPSVPVMAADPMGSQPNPGTTGSNTTPGMTGNNTNTGTVFNGHHPTNEERAAAGKAALIASAQAKANGVRTATRLVPTPGSTPDYFGASGNFAQSPLPTFDASGNIVPGTGIRKFVDGLPGLGPTAANNLGQYVSLAHPDTLTYPGDDYYELAAVQFTEKLHSDLPPTTLRVYVQLNNGTSGAANTIAPDPVQYLGATIVATANRPVRIKLTNLLPTTASGGDLFLPADTSIMGAGTGPNLGTELYTDNRATIHLHGGLTPWVSDGTPHQWVTPNLQTTSYPKGASTQDVPDMPISPGGSMTFYYTNAQSARLMFYHDHALGITRLNVYDGLAAGYVLTDQPNRSLSTAARFRAPPSPSLTGLSPASERPLSSRTRPLCPFAGPAGCPGPHLESNLGRPGQALVPPCLYARSAHWAVTAMGRWDYGPWFGIPGILNGPVSNPTMLPAALNRLKCPAYRISPSWARPSSIRLW